MTVAHSAIRESVQKCAILIIYGEYDYMIMPVVVSCDRFKSLTRRLFGGRFYLATWYNTLYCHSDATLKLSEDHNGQTK